MMGLIILLVGSLIVGLAMDTALDMRLALVAVRRAEQRTIAELEARSLMELAARELSFDPDRRRDSRNDSWACLTLPSDQAYQGCWPSDAHVAVTDMERDPPPKLLAMIRRKAPTLLPRLRSEEGTSNIEHRTSNAEMGASAGRRSKSVMFRDLHIDKGLSMSRHKTFSVEGMCEPNGESQWINVLTADEDCWQALGISTAASKALVARSRRSLTDPAELLSVAGLSPRERQLLSQLESQGFLRLRSELFAVCCDMAGICFKGVLRREPAKGSIRMISFERAISHDDA